MSANLIAFFDGLRTEADLQLLVDEQREEGLTLELKRKRKPGSSDLDRDDASNFSKALSAFANAVGGVLIFGVETTDTKNPPDRAIRLEPIYDPERFRARLADSILNATHRTVDGVRLEIIPGKSGHGYVKCLIPASDTIPHRAMLANREYYRRLSTGVSVRMEHYELEEVFGRRLAPALRLAMSLKIIAGNDIREELHFRFLNEGRGLALHAGFFCELTADCQIIGGSGPPLSNVTNINEGRPIVNFYDSQVAIHPNGIFSSLGFVLIRRANRCTPIRVQATWYAEHMPTKREECEIALASNPIFKGEMANFND